jgi:hypothetical protein
MTDRKRLETAIEKNIHGLLNEIKESTVDFTVLTVRKKHPEIDREQLSVILDVVRAGIENGFMTTIDRYMGKLDKELTELTGDENPLDAGTPTKTDRTPGKSKRARTVSA